MSGSGLIYAAIAAMWAAVLIPMWLRNHDTAAENRSAEKFGQAMRVLSRKERDDVDQADEAIHPHGEFEAADDRRAPTADRSYEQVSEPLAEQRAASSRPSAPHPRPRPRQRPQRAQRTLAQRRARTLATLAIALVALVVAAVATPVPWWAPLPVAALVVAFVVHLRVQAIQHERRRTGVRSPVRAQAATTQTRTTEEARDERAVAAAPAHERTASGFVSGPSRAVVVETKGSSSNAEVTADDDSWRPNPLPLPTYVTAPKAIRPIKVIDLTTPGAWTSGRLLDDDFADEDLLAAELANDELDALLEHEAAPPVVAPEHDEADRRAVGD